MNENRSLAAALHFIYLANKEERWINAIKLQKLLFIAHGGCLAVNDEALVDEAFEAWKHGPHLPSVFQTFIGLGSRTLPPYLGKNGKEVFSALEIDVMNRVWNHYKDYSEEALSTRTQGENTPWQKIVSTTPEPVLFPGGPQIPNALVKDYFSKFFKKTDEQVPA